MMQKRLLNLYWLSKVNSFMLIMGESALSVKESVPSGLVNYLFQDAKGVYKKSSFFSCILRCYYLLPFRRIVKYRFIQYLQRRSRIRFITKWLEVRYRIKTSKLGLYLEPSTRIGAGVRFPHGFPVVIHSEAIIGQNCIIHPNVQIGTSRTKEGAPMIGNYCFLGNGCHIIGNCKIGDWCFISPGAFVCKDIPSGSVVGYGLNNIISDKGKEVVSVYL